MPDRLTNYPLPEEKIPGGATNSKPGKNKLKLHNREKIISVNESRAAIDPMLRGHEGTLLSRFLNDDAKLRQTPQLRVEHFADPVFAEIFAAECALSDDGYSTNLLAVQDYLRRRNKLDFVGPHTLNELAAESVASLSEPCFRYALDEVLNAYRERATAQIGKDLFDGKLSCSEAREKLADIERTNEDGLAVLAARRFDAATPPPKARPIFSLAGSGIATPGNIQAVQAKAKEGKTALVGAMLGSTFGTSGDTFGFSSSNPSRAAVIHFDTEQSPYDHYAVIMQALRRAKSEPQDWLRSYRLADVGIDQRLGLLRFELDAARKECGAIHSAFLDGVADFCHDPNDPAEAFALVAELHKLAIDYDTTIVCVLHENPGSETGKTRGHLGSQLERKAETNLRLAKDSDGITVVFTERARHAHVTREHGPRFAWNHEAAMHLSVETQGATKTSAKRERLAELAAQIFKDVPEAVGLTWEQLHERIETIEGLSRSGARKRYDALRDFKVIRKNGEKYRPT